MPVIKIQGFGGIAPAVPARYLTESQAQIAINCPVFKGSIQPLADVGGSLLTLPKTGVPQTIYRYGQDTISDTSYWFHWMKRTGMGGESGAVRGLRAEDYSISLVFPIL